LDGRRIGNGARQLKPTPLDRRRAYKPLDFGNGIVAGTVGPSGRLLSLGVAHAELGRLWLTATDPFPESQREDEDAVRAHRAALAAPDRPSFGLSLLDRAGDAYFIEDALPLAVLDAGDVRVEVTTFAPAGRTGLVQLIRVSARRQSLRLAPEWTGRPRLGRADYTQITEGGRLPSPASAPREGRDGEVLWIDDRVLDGAVAFAVPGPLEVPAGGSGLLVVAVAIGARLDDVVAEARALAREATTLAGAEVRARMTFWRDSQLDGEDERAHVIRRGVAYALDCAQSRVSDRAVAIITDHEILPLVWTRDAYYICRALLGVAPKEPRAREAVEQFIVWLFKIAERPEGAWPRSALASGRAKDIAFQLDQQIYPPLLVADHARLTGTAALRERYAVACRATLDALLARRSPFGLVPTAETPADDPLRQPFHFSSHVLLWHALREFGHGAAGEIRAATLEHFVSEGRFAYAISGPRAAGARHYHDANDLPTVFAPGWGFCEADDPRWRATIAFAWSDANQGYFAGRFGGLGSLHTPRPWTLGDLQEIVVARVQGDRRREARARARLSTVETWDCHLAEAYDQETGAVAARHWFGWPAAVRALLESDPMLTAP
jgi:hypothetical protein